MALFDGVDSPITQSFGLGVLSDGSDDELAEMEAFLTECGAAVNHEVSPLAGVALHARLSQRGYVPVEFTSVMIQEVERWNPGTGGKTAGTDGPVRVRVISAGEERLWAKTSARGWAEDQPQVVGFLHEIGEVMACTEGTWCLLAEVDGRAAGVASVRCDAGVALFNGASTVPEMRRLGVQRALLAARMRIAADQYCDLAMMGAAPGSTSQRNAERQGFRIAYTRVKWQRAAG
jgi:GNAT superfamily N-acetyltransferase